MYDQLKQVHNSDFIKSLKEKYLMPVEEAEANEIQALPVEEKENSEANDETLQQMFGDPTQSINLTDLGESKNSESQMKESMRILQE